MVVNHRKQRKSEPWWRESTTVPMRHSVGLISSLVDFRGYASSRSRRAEALRSRGIRFEYFGGVGVGRA